MLGKSDPNGNGRLALALADVLLQRLVASGVMTEADLDDMVAKVEAQLTREHSITSEGALLVLRSSKLGR